VRQEAPPAADFRESRTEIGKVQFWFLPILDSSKFDGDVKKRKEEAVEIRSPSQEIVTL
jgi:hypothetical protein